MSLYINDAVYNILQIIFKFKHTKSIANSLCLSIERRACTIQHGIAVRIRLYAQSKYWVNIKANPRLELKVEGLAKHSWTIQCATTTAVLLASRYARSSYCLLRRARVSIIFIFLSAFVALWFIFRCSDPPPPTSQAFWVFAMSILYNVKLLYWCLQWWCHVRMVTAVIANYYSY